MAEPIRWGVLGAGGIAATVMSDLTLGGGTLAAVGARDLNRAAAFAATHGATRSYGSYDELVHDPDVDVVYIATTHGQHHEHALLALRARKPVLVEKAFTLNAREAREVVAQARGSGLFCMEAMWLRFNPLIRRAQQLVEDGAIGDVIGVRADLSKRFEYDPAARLFDLAAGGGALLDLGVYTATFAWLFLGKPTTVTAAGSLAPTGSDLTVAMQWGYRDGRVAQIYNSAAGDSPFAGLITGTDGWIRIETRIHRPSALTLYTGRDIETIPAEPDPGRGYGRELAEVERCLRAGELESPLVPLDDTVAILETIDEARRQLGVRYAADEDWSE
jgi:predicted dehydrogenase